MGWNGGGGGLRGGWNVVEEWHDKWMVKKTGVKRMVILVLGCEGEW